MLPAVGPADFARVVWSPALALGSTGGFAFLLRPGRLIGALKPATFTVILTTLGHTATEPGKTTVKGTVVQRREFLTTDREEARRFIESLGADPGILESPGTAQVVRRGPLPPGPPPGPSPRDLVRDLEAAKVFEIPVEEVDGIEVSRPDPSDWGRVVIRARRGVQVVNVAPPAPGGEDILKSLVPVLEEFLPGRVVRRP